MFSSTITVIGSLNCDLTTLTPRLPSRGETLTATSFSIVPGGKGSNQALAAQRLSRISPSTGLSRPSGSQEPEIKVCMLGAVGDDQFQQVAIATLKEDGVDVSGVRVVKGQTTGVAVVLVETEVGENRILLEPGANHSLRPEEFLTLESLAGGRAGGDRTKPDLLVLQLEIPRQTVEQILETAGREGVDVLLNPAPAVALSSSVYKRVQHLIVNETEAAILSGKELQDLEEEEEMGWRKVTDRFLEQGAKNVVVTLGARGAYYSDAVGKGCHAAAEKGVKVVDTTGAGDTFVGAYAVEVVRQKRKEVFDIGKAVKWASKAAARAVERHGAQDAIPWANELE